jgi:hypothetical protein
MSQTTRRGIEADRDPFARFDRAGIGFVRWPMGAAVIALLATLMTAGLSHAVEPAPGEKVHEVTWLHEAPVEVDGFIIFVSPISGSASDARQVDVGKPGGSKSSSVQLFSALVSVGLDEYVAVAAVGRNGTQSILSDWGQPQPSQPGQPLVVEP